jgi:hypothetical protein
MFAPEGVASPLDGENLTLKRIPYDVERTLIALRESPLADSVVEGLSARLRPTEQSADPRAAAKG